MTRLCRGVCGVSAAAVVAMAGVGPAAAAVKAGGNGGTAVRVHPSGLELAGVGSAAGL